MERYFLKQAMNGNRADSYMVADPTGLWVMAADAESRIRELEQQLTAAREREGDARRYEWLRYRSWAGEGAYYFRGPKFTGLPELDLIEQWAGRLVPDCGEG